MSYEEGCDMSVLSEVITAIEAQQPEQHSAVWMVGEQLKDICRSDPAAAELLLADLLHNPDMTLANAEKKIEERARKNKVGKCGCVTPAEAEDILRDFFGLGAPGRAVNAPVVIELADFL